MGYENHTKIAYIKKGDIEEALHQGKIDDYDVCITKDTGEVLFVSPDKGIYPTRSRVYCFGTYEDALQYINTSEDTYEGQILSIYEGTEYRGYVVNRRNGQYWADPLAAPEIHVDYYQVHELTKAEYDALPEDKLTNNNIYLITDEEPSTSETVTIPTGFGTLVLNPVVHIAELIIETANIALMTNSLALGTIPKEYRPKSNFNFMCAHGYDSGKMVCCTVEAESGTVAVNGQIEVTPNQIIGNATYLY